MGKIKLTQSASPITNKSFFKKASQVNVKTNSNIKSFKDDNSTLKTSLLNSSFPTKNNNDWEKKSIRSVNNHHHTIDKKNEMSKIDKKNEIVSTKTYNANTHFSNKNINIKANDDLFNGIINKLMDRNKNAFNQNNMENKSQR